MNLTDLERDKLQILLNDEILLTVLKKALTLSIESQRPEVTEENNQLLGEKYRAYLSSKNAIDGAINLLLSQKVEKLSNKLSSRAR